ncbi:hypothetical protein SDC9_122148 [bioreactor metagenome]|uniref:Uncharacterized protein n=1 Tax=bioreactor metagenome TaxID=1076179 RepID=A0A645CDY4_9ZZZZ
MEGNQIGRFADAADRQGVADQANRAIGVKGRGDEAGFRFQRPQLIADLRLADNQTLDAQLQRVADHIRLIAADDNAVFVVEQQILAGGGQSDGHFAGDTVNLLAGFVEDLSLDDGQEVVQRNVADLGIADGRHIIGRDVSGGEHSEQRSVLVGDGDGGDIGVLMNNMPRPADGDAGVQQGRGVVFQIAHLGPHVLEQHGGSKVEAVQNGLRLIVDPTETRRCVFPVAQRITQGGIGHGGDNRIRVGIAVPSNIDGVHANMFLSLCGRGGPLQFMMNLLYYIPLDVTRKTTRNIS